MFRIRSKNFVITAVCELNFLTHKLREWILRMAGQGFGVGKMCIEGLLCCNARLKCIQEETKCNTC